MPESHVLAELSLAIRSVVSHLRSLAPRAQIITRALRRSLDRARASVVVAEEFEATLDMRSVVARAAGLPEGALARVANPLREEGDPVPRPSHNAPRRSLVRRSTGAASSEWLPLPEGPGTDCSIAELTVDTHTTANVLAVEGSEGLHVNPAPDRKLAAGDRALATGNTEALAKLRRLLGEGP